MKASYFFILILFLLLSCSEKKEKIHPRKENITESVYASGIVKSNNQYQVFSPVNGLIQKKFVKEGDTVTVNAPIILVVRETAKLNEENAKLAVEYSSIRANENKLKELEANINFLKIKKQNDSSLLERQRNLWQNGIGSRNDLEQRELAFKNDVSSYNSASYQYMDLQKQLSFSAAQSKNNLRISQTASSDYIVKSKINGRVYSLEKETGEMVTAQTPIAVIGEGDFLLELQVDEYDIKKILPGQQVLVTMDSYKNTVFEATVSRIIPYMNDRTRSFTVEAVFNNKPPKLYPNLSVEANITIQVKKEVITIPRNYLIDRKSVV